MSASARQEDFLFAEHVLRRGFATEEQVQECLGLLERLRGELELEETLENILLKKGYLAKAQAGVIQQDINPESAGRAKNQIEGYQLLVRLGSGAMGSVYKAHHQKLNIPVALKVLRIDLAKSRTQVERLKREAQLAARLNHPNIVRSLDVGESNGFHYFAMEFVDGKTVRQMLHPGRMREKDALRIIRHVAHALEHAHTHGVVHRDVKPANIILTQGGKVKLADFGLARGKEPSDLTLDQASIGTPQYLAPEQARRGADATPRSDLFSLGASLYHMVTGRPPFSGENLGEIFQKVLGCDFDPPESAVPDLSLDTVYLIHRLMRFHPRERYASATNLLADLQKLESGQRIAPPGFKGDYQRYLTRRRVRRGLVGAAAVLVLVAASLFTAQTISAHNAETARVASCRRANDFAKNELARPNSVADLEDLFRRMTKARPRDCKEGEVSGLTQRIRWVREDIEALRKAESLLKQAGDEGANFQSLDEDATKLIRPIHLEGPLQRAQHIELEIRRLSKEAALKRGREIYNPNMQESASAALDELEAFRKDLRRRYLPVEFPEAEEIDIDQHTHALRMLKKRWDGAETDYGADFRTHKANSAYKDARRTLNKLIATRDKARDGARSLGLTKKNFLHWFANPNGDPRKRELTSDEKEHYKRISDEVTKLLGKNDPDAAKKVVDEFEKQADEYADTVNLLYAKISRHRQQVAESQGRELRMLEEVVKRALEDRQYGGAWKLVSEAYARPDWMPILKADLKELYEQALIYKALLERFTQNAARLGLRPAGGPDPDLFLDAEGNPVTLKDWAGSLEQVLAFEEPRDNKLRGYFHVVESYHTLDPRKEAAHIATAVLYLRKVGDPLFPELGQREAKVRALVNERELRAKELHKLLEAAEERNNHAKAWQYLRILLSDKRDGLSYTDHVDTQRKDLLDKRGDFRRRGQAGLLRLEASLPERGFAYDAESGRASFRFTFKEWWPDEGKVLKHELDQLARIFWHKFFKDRYAKKQWPRLVERAKHQLLWFNELLVPDKINGGARLQLDQNAAWLKHGNLRAITLHNPFRSDTDWSIEILVSWDVDAKGVKKQPKGEDLGILEPGYFVLAAGEFQAGVLATHQPYGGGLGGRIFKQKALMDGFEKRFEVFQRRIMNKPGAKKLAHGGDRAYFRQFDPRDAPYRMRLEKKGAKLRFFAAPLKVWKQLGGFDERRDFFIQMAAPHKSILEKGMRVDRQRVFRIFSLNPCRLHEVVLEGRVPTE